MIHALDAVQLATLSMVVRTEDGRAFGLTAGHALKVFLDGDSVSYFPDGVRTRVGSCDPPVALGDNADLGRFEVDPDRVLRTPIDFGRIPRVLPPDELGSLDGKELIFFGGQTGRSAGKLLHVGPSEGDEKTLFVQLVVPDLVPGDSGGPLYYDDGTALFLVGTLVGGSSAGGGVSEARFLHPAVGLERLRLAANG